MKKAIGIVILILVLISLLTGIKQFIHLNHFTGDGGMGDYAISMSGLIMSIVGPILIIIGLILIKKKADSKVP